MTSSVRHIPVMLKEVLENLCIQNKKTYVDATFGNGGYTEAILNSADCKVIAIDRDPSVIQRATELKEKYGNRFEFRAGTFGELSDLVKEDVDGVVFDIGVSSMQLDDGFRGFSFNKEAPLDMRMSLDGISAKDIVNNLYQFLQSPENRGKLTWLTNSGIRRNEEIENYGRKSQRRINGRNPSPGGNFR